jgi:DNA-directed RNA polymerase specialized sigma24 family protein
VALIAALRHLADLSQAQVADALGVRPAKVAQHVHRGMAACAWRWATRRRESQLRRNTP